MARRVLSRELTWAPIQAPTGGQFMLGCVPDDNECFKDEKQRHAVILSRSYELMTHEVTVAQFRRFSDVTEAPVGRWIRPWDVFRNSQPSWSADNHPVVNVSWFEATAFCKFVGGRLPTEAEWEYAARGGNADVIYPWGNAYSPDQANGRKADGTDLKERSAPVGSFLPNRFGLYDIVGNVWEWVSSVYRPYPYRGDDGREDPGSREARVARGGSWSSTPKNLRVSNRIDYSPANRIGTVGIRCARDALTSSREDRR
jgi:formylglycine-generating enzyme required for sulfatase activity